jgi:hypothetical protein
LFEQLELERQAFSFSWQSGCEEKQDEIRFHYMHHFAFSKMGHFQELFVCDLQQVSKQLVSLIKKKSKPTFSSASPPTAKSGET